MITTRNKSVTKREHEARKAVLNTCCLDLDDATKSNSGIKPYGMVSQMVLELKSSCPWISRDIINYAYKMFLDSKKKDEELKKASQPSITTTSDPQSKGGRPLGTTDTAKFNQKRITMSYLDAIAHEFHEQKNVAKREGRNVKKGCIERIIEANRKEFNLLDDVKFDKVAI